MEANIEKAYRAFGFKAIALRIVLMCTGFIALITAFTHLMHFSIYVAVFLGIIIAGIFPFMQYLSRLGAFYIQFDKQLFELCDADGYLEKCKAILEATLSHKDTKTLFYQGLQNRYIVAFLAKGNVSEAKQYLKQSELNPRKKLYKILNANICLQEAIDAGDTTNARLHLQEFSEYLKNKRSDNLARIYEAEILRLEGKTEEGLILAKQLKENTLFNSVTKNYILGCLYKDMGDTDCARKHFDYVIAYGGTTNKSNQAKIKLSDCID